MEIIRDYNDSFIKDILNDPDVHNSFVEKASNLNLTSMLQDSNIILLTDRKYGGIFYRYYKNGIYDSHPVFKKKGRGEYAIHFARKTIKYMFENTQCLTLRAYSPLQFKHAQRFASLCGLKKTRIIEHKVKDGFDKFVEYELDYAEYKKGLKNG